MAQWRGLYSGNNHTTKVRDLESSLRRAVLAWRTAPWQAEREKLAKPVRDLARRLLAARTRMLKSRLATGDPRQIAAGLESLRAREEALRAGGMEAILAEFDASVPPA